MKIRPKNYFWILTVSIYFGMFAFCLTGMILLLCLPNYENRFLEYAGILVVIVVMILTAIEFLFCLKRNIELNSTAIIVKKDKTIIGARLQYEVKVNYSDIQEIGLTISNHDSKNKFVPIVITPMLYIVFNLKNGKQQKINVYYYREKDIILLIDEIKKRAKEIGNELSEETGEQLLRDIEEKERNLFKRKKRKIKK